MAYSKDDIEILDRLAKKLGAKQATVFMQVLGKELQFINAINSVVGQEIYKDCVSFSQAIMEKIVEDDFESDKDEMKAKAELRAYMKIMGRWNARIEAFHQRDEKFKTIIGGK